MRTNVIIGTVFMAVFLIGTACAGTTNNAEFTANVNYAHDHHAWSLVTISSNEDFKGTLHIYCYHIVNIDRIQMYDASTGHYWETSADGLTAGNDCHFWLNNQCPSHACTDISDNSDKLGTLYGW